MRSSRGRRRAGGRGRPDRRRALAAPAHRGHGDRERPRHRHQDHQIVRPRLELLAVRRRHAQHLGDDDGGQRIREPADQVELGVLAQSVEEILDHGGDARSQVRDHPRGERFGDEATQARVNGRVGEHGPAREDVERRREPLLSLGFEAVAVPRDAIGRQARIAKGGMDVVVAREQPGPQPAVPEDGFSFAQLTQRRVGIRDRVVAEEAGGQDTDPSSSHGRGTLPGMHETGLDVPRQPIDPARMLLRLSLRSDRPSCGGWWAVWSTARNSLL